jgi:hypothetical protein
MELPELLWCGFLFVGSDGVFFALDMLYLFDEMLLRTTLILQK